MVITTIRFQIRAFKAVSIETLPTNITTFISNVNIFA